MNSHDQFEALRAVQRQTEGAADDHDPFFDQPLPSSAITTGGDYQGEVATVEPEVAEDKGNLDIIPMQRTADQRKEMERIIYRNNGAADYHDH
jgi:hypothetical protein